MNKLTKSDAIDYARLGASAPALYDALYAVRSALIAGEGIDADLACQIEQALIDAAPSTSSARPWWKDFA